MFSGGFSSGGAKIITSSFASAVNGISSSMAQEGSVNFKQVGISATYGAITGKVDGFYSSIVSEYGAWGQFSANGEIRYMGNLVGSVFVDIMWNATVIPDFHEMLDHYMQSMDDQVNYAISVADKVSTMTDNMVKESIPTFEHVPSISSNGYNGGVNTYTYPNNTMNSGFNTFPSSTLNPGTGTYTNPWNTPSTGTGTYTNPWNTPSTGTGTYTNPWNTPSTGTGTNTYPWDRPSTGW